MNRRNFLKLTGIAAIFPSICSKIRADNHTTNLVDDWILFKNKIPKKGQYIIIKLEKYNIEETENHWICKVDDIRFSNIVQVYVLNTKTTNKSKIISYINSLENPYLKIFRKDNISWKPYYLDRNILPELDKKVEVIELPRPGWGAGYREFYRITRGITYNNHIPNKKRFVHVRTDGIYPTLQKKTTKPFCYWRYI